MLRGSHHDLPELAIAFRQAFSTVEGAVQVVQRAIGGKSLALGREELISSAGRLRYCIQRLQSRASWADREHDEGDGYIVVGVEMR